GCLQSQCRRGPGVDEILSRGVVDDSQTEHCLRLQDARGDAPLPPAPRRAPEGCDFPPVNRSTWLDPKGLRIAILFAIVAALANAVWIFLDHSTPSWDQSYYLTDTLQYRFGFAADGIHGLLSTIHAKDPGHGPLFTTAMLPFFYAFGNSARSGLILNAMLAVVFYIAAGQIAWI